MASPSYLNRERLCWSIQFKFGKTKSSLLSSHVSEKSWKSDLFTTESVRSQELVHKLQQLSENFEITLRFVINSINKWFTVINKFRESLRNSFSKSSIAVVIINKENILLACQNNKPRPVTLFGRNS